MDFAESMQAKFVGFLLPVAQGNPLDESKVDDWIKNSFGAACPIYEKRLAEHGKRFLTGDKVTIADFKCFQAILSASDANRGTVLSPEILGKINACIGMYPSTQRWVNNMKQELATYLASGRPATPI